jgi:hypothetical protein
VTVQASALNLLSRLCASDPSLPWRAETVRALIMAQEDEGARGDDLNRRLPFIVWLGDLSLDAERSLGQYRVARDALQLMHYLVEQACDDSWEGKATILPLNLCAGFVCSMVDFAARVLLTLDGWTFGRAMDRWLLCLSCLRVINAFAGRAFAVGESATEGLEAHRRALLQRFRHDSVLLSALLRCVEYFPATALAASLESRQRQRPTYRFLDELHPDQAEGDDEGPEGAAGGLFMAREGGVLPLGFEQGLAVTASRDERAVLEELCVQGLQTLGLVVKQFMLDTHDGHAPLPGADEGPSAMDVGDPSLLLPGALDLLTSAAELPGASSMKRWAGRARPLVTHMALIASLALFPEASRRPGRPSVAVAALDAQAVLVRYMAALRRMREREQRAALKDWPAQLPFPFPPGVLEDLLSVSDARGLRRGLFRSLVDTHTPMPTVVAALDYLVEVMRLQPSLARHLVFFRRVRREGTLAASSREADADERCPSLEAVLSKLLHEGYVLLQAKRRGGAAGSASASAADRKKDADQRKDAELLMASVARFLCAVLRHASKQRRVELLAALEQRAWGELASGVEKLELDKPTEVFVGSPLLSYCYELSVHRYALEAFALLAAVMGSERAEGAPATLGKALENGRAAMDRLAGLLLASGGGAGSRTEHLLIYLAASYNATEVASLEARVAGGKAGQIAVSTFRMADWEAMMADPNPRRFGSQSFVYDVGAFVRYVHTSEVGALMGRGPGEADAVKAKRMAVSSMCMLNQYHSVAAAQHTLNKAFNGMAQVGVYCGR